MTDNVATLEGFTKELFAFSNSVDLHLLVRPDADLESRFKAWDCDEQEWLSVNGWMFDFEPVDDNA